MKRGKKWKEAIKKVDRTKAYEIEDAAGLIAKVSFSKFTGTVEAAVKIGYKSFQNVRGVLNLPHGTGKTVRVVVIAREDKHAEAKEAGADYVGGTEMVEKIQKENWTDFDACIATPDMMREVGKLGPILGRKGLMPKPRAGTVTNDIARAVKDVKGGQVEYRPDKSGVIHLGIGRVNFTPAQLVDNLKSFYQGLMKDKPSDAKGEYIRSFYIAPTMGPGIKVNPRSLA